MVDWKKIEKNERIIALKDRCDDLFVRRYMETESFDDQDKKIKVLEELISGKMPNEIKEYYDVVKLPEGIWET